MIAIQSQIDFTLNHYGLFIQFDPEDEDSYIHYSLDSDIVQQLLTITRGGYRILYRTNSLLPVRTTEILTRLSDHLPIPYNQFYYYLKERL